MRLQHNELTESESEGELRPDGVEEPATDWDVEDDCPPSDEEDVAADIDSTEVQGPWILNTRTGWGHRAFQCTEGSIEGGGDRWGLACRPAAKLPNWYAFYTQDPRVDGFQLCGHGGCFAGT